MARFPSMVCALLGVLFAAGSLPAYAAGADSPADVLFQKAVKDMQAGKYDAACESLRASLKLEEKAGTLYALGDCEATRGRGEEALAAFTQYLVLVDAMKGPDLEKHAERANVAREQKKRIAGELLFEKAKTMLDAGRLDEACAALVQSNKVDPRPGTLLSMADCEDSRGRLATAKKHYKAYLEAFAAMTSPTREKHEERAKIAEARLSALSAEIPTVKLYWTGKVPEGLVVYRSGEKGSPLTLGVRVEVDPGTAGFVVEEPGKAPSERTLTLQKGERKELDLSVSSSVLRNENAADATKPVEGPAPSKGMASMKPGGFVGIGVGGLGIVLGGVFGGLAMKQKDLLQDLTCTEKGCPSNRRAEVDRFHAYGNMSTALFVVGTAFVGAGVTMLVLAPKGEKKDAGAALRVRAAVLPASGFWSVEGSF